MTQLTFDNMYTSLDGIWTVMLHACHLTSEKNPGNDNYLLRIPNEEIMRSLDNLVVAIAGKDYGNGIYLKEIWDLFQKQVFLSE